MNEESRLGNPVQATAIALAAAIVFSVTFSWQGELWTFATSTMVLFASTLFLLCFLTVRHVRPTFNSTLVFLLLLPAWGASQLLFGRSVYPFQTWLNTVLLSGAACAYWLASEAFQFPELYRAFRNFLMVFAGLVSILAILQLLTSGGQIYWMITIPYDFDPLGPFRNRDRYAAFIELLLPLVATEVVQSEEKSFLWAVTAALMYGSVVAGGSRAGVIVITIEILLVTILFTRRRALPEGRSFKAVATIMLVIVFATALGWGLVMQRFRSDTQVFEDRRQLLVSSIQMWHARPLTGFGLGSWPSVYPQFAVFDPGTLVNHAHNDWAEWASDGGIFFVGIYFLVAWRAARLAGKSPAALGVTAVFLHSLVDFNFREYSIVLLVSVLLALAEAPVPTLD
jgi:hypothetical protein